MAAVSQAKPRPSVMPVWIIIFLTLVAMLLGWVVKTFAENQTRNVERAGVFASVPAGWTVRFGVAQEELIFAATDPFNPKVAFSVYLLPSVPGGKLTDSVTSRNLDIAKSKNSYKVMDQAPVKERNQEGYKVVFSYVEPNGPDTLADVIKGMDYYFSEANQVVIFSMTSPVTWYEESLPQFYRFVRSAKVSVGGVK